MVKYMESPHYNYCRNTKRRNGNSMDYAVPTEQSVHFHFPGSNQRRLQNKEKHPSEKYGGMNIKNPGRRHHRMNQFLADCLSESKHYDRDNQNGHEEIEMCFEQAPAFCLQGCFPRVDLIAARSLRNEQGYIVLRTMPGPLASQFRFEQRMLRPSANLGTPGWSNKIRRRCDRRKPCRSGDRKKGRRRVFGYRRRRFHPARSFRVELSKLLQLPILFFR